jgi:LmbE family N-acetylglucosaminyl deacetylase
MTRSFLRDKIHFIHKLTISSVDIERQEDDLGLDAVIFSPHFDDETLGCGGTIIKKKRAGADIKIVFMTDGSKSHRHLISEDKLKAIRANEGIAATQSLGLEKSDIFLLGFEETKLNEQMNIATNKVADILLQQQPEEVFIPFHKEPQLWSLDHLATYNIVKSVLQKYGKNTIIYEYPIWFWYNWPWINPMIQSPQELLKSSKNSLISIFRLLKELRYAVFIGEVLQLKRMVLDQYRSQMTRIIPDPRWRVLSDISNGEWLECFFQEYEVFSRYKNII